MSLFFNICSGISVGIIVGFLCGGLRWLGHKSYSEAQVKTTREFLIRVSRILKYFTFFFLAQGLIWCVYFLVLGAVLPAQAEYATNMSQLIVSVLTVISIIFAFFEFLNRTNGPKP